MAPVRCRRSASGRVARRGITLFEVVLALAIFVGAYAAIGQILETGSRAAVRSQVSAEAVYLAEGKMNEMISGILPLTAVQEANLTIISGQNTAANSQWKWSAAVTESGIVGLLRVEVNVRNTGSGFRQESRTLVRLVRDPAYLAELETAAASAAALAAEEAAAATGAM